MKVLEEMLDIDVRSVSRESLVDIKDVKIDVKKERKERVLEFLKQIKNPYCFICNGMIVKMNFSKEGETLEDRLNKYFLSL